jgi:hypothetical protein
MCVDWKDVLLNCLCVWWMMLCCVNGALCIGNWECFIGNEEQYMEKRNRELCIIKLNITSNSICVTRNIRPHLCSTLEV